MNGRRREIEKVQEEEERRRGRWEEEKEGGEKENTAGSWKVSSAAWSSIKRISPAGRSRKASQSSLAPWLQPILVSLLNFRDYDLPTLTQDRNISLSCDGEMKFINLLASLCFSMETVHKVPPPPTEKHQERQSAQSQAAGSPAPAYFPPAGWRIQIWGVEPLASKGLRILCLFCLSNQSLLLLVHWVSPQDPHWGVFRDVIDGSCTHRRGCMVLRCLAESWTTNPGLLLQPYRVHACTGSVCLLFPFVPWTLLPLFASWICTFMEYDAFHQVLSHVLLQCSSKVMFIYLSIDEGTETQRVEHLIHGAWHHSALFRVFTQASLQRRTMHGLAVTDVVLSSEGNSWKCVWMTGV